MTDRKNKHSRPQRTRSITSAASVAREIAGYSVDEAARRARIGAAYLRRIEIHGNAPYALARRLSAIYDCPISFFLYPDLGGRTLK